MGLQLGYDSTDMRDHATHATVICILALGLVGCAADAGPSEDAETFFRHGQQLAATGDHEGALLAFDESLELDGSDGNAAHYHRANTLIELSDYTEALKTLDRLVKTRPDYTEAAETRQELLRLMNACGE